MPCYRVHRMKDSPSQQFRWAPHTSGATGVRPKDYEPDETVDAVSVYAAWDALKETPRPLRVGDLLEIQGGNLRIYKYVGFEEAYWVMPEVTGLESVAPAAGTP